MDLNKSDLYDSLNRLQPDVFPLTHKNIFSHSMEELAIESNYKSYFYTRQYLNPLPFDSYIEELSVLVGRCHENKKLKNDLDSKAIELLIELNSSEENIKIRDASVDAGLFDLQHNVASLEKKYAEKLVKSSSLGSQTVAESIDQRKPAHQSYIDRVDFFSTVTDLSAPLPNPELRNAAKALARNSLDLEHSSLEPGLHQANYAVITAKLLDELADIRQKFHDVDKDTRRKLYELEKKYLEIRRQFSIKEGSGLNYRERINNIYNIFSIDYTNALARVDAIRQGLSDVLGIEVEEPGEYPVSVENILVWLRKLMDSLIRELQYEYAQTKSIRIRELISEDNWVNLINGNVVSFVIPLEFFYEQKCIRVNSISVESISAHKLPPVSIFMRLPVVAKTRLINGEEGKLDQHNIPEVIIGDLQPRGLETRMTRYASRAIQNASPIGTWSLHVDTGSKTYEIDDLQINIGVTACEAM